MPRRMPLPTSPALRVACKKLSAFLNTSTKLEYPTPSFENKICAADQLAGRVALLPRPLVFTNGCFDVLHRGHVTYLAQARSLGASLIVGVNSDASVKRQGKGGDRPINPQDDRMEVLAALES